MIPLFKLSELLSGASSLPAQKEWEITLGSIILCLVFFTATLLSSRDSGERDDADNKRMFARLSLLFLSLAALFAIGGLFTWALLILCFIIYLGYLFVINVQAAFS